MLLDLYHFRSTPPKLNGKLDRIHPPKQNISIKRARLVPAVPIFPAFLVRSRKCASVDVIDVDDDDDDDDEDNEENEDDES